MPSIVTITRFSTFGALAMNSILNYKNYLILKIALLLQIIAGVFLLLSFQTKEKKINGVVIAASEQKTDKKLLKSVTNISANYIELKPVAFSKENKPMLFYNKPTQFWGEREEGIETLIIQAHESHLKVFLNPSVFIAVKGSPATFNLKDDVTWQKWENRYRDYILSYAVLAEKHHVAIFSIGNSMNNAIADRPEFWKRLITDVRKIYSGKITYGADWNDYQNIPFWSKLDFIGINAYYPLTTSKTPDIKTLTGAWRQPFFDLKYFSQKNKKQILFTEFGYRSADGCAGNQNELPDDHLYIGKANQQSQAAAYAYLLTLFYKENWFAGSFAYNWQLKNDAGGSMNNDYTPQNKTAQEILKIMFSKY